MLIGIKITPATGDPNAFEVFYAGNDAAALAAKHAELMKANTDGKSRFGLLRHPSYIPLASIITPTEDHPDTIAARKRQAELADKAIKAKTETVQPELLTEETLGKKTKTQLLELADSKKVTIDDKATKADIIAALLAIK